MGKEFTIYQLNNQSFTDFLQRSCNVGTLGRKFRYFKTIFQAVHTSPLKTG